MRGGAVIYKSMAYSAVTEEVCIPVLEKHSGLGWREDFSVGYSPKRINPGDRECTLEQVVKVVSENTAATLGRATALCAISSLPATICHQHQGHPDQSGLSDLQ